MNQYQEPEPEPAKPTRKPSSGPFLILTLLFLLTLVYAGSQGQDSEMAEDEFWYRLHTGGIAELSVKPPRELIGTLQSQEGQPGSPFTVQVPETNVIWPKVRAALARSRDMDSPIRFDRFEDLVSRNEAVPVQAWPLKIRRLQYPEDPESTYTEHRVFIQYEDSKGSHYAEILAPGNGDINMAKVRQLVTSAGATIENDLIFDAVTGLKTDDGNSTLMFLLGSFGPILLLILLFWFLFMRQMKGQGQGLLSFGRSRATVYNKENRTGVTFDDVAGIEEAEAEVSEIIQFLKFPEKFHRLGGRIPRGVMMVGPPGTGKTLLAKAIAGEADVPFISISGSDFVEMFVGVGASRVRDLFSQAKESAPCIIFLDEIDAVGRKRGAGMGGGNDEREQTLNAILVEMDGFDTSENIIVIAATNRPDVLDPALLRPGRFDREIIIDLPDVAGREKILEVHAREVKLAEGVDLSSVARGTPGFSGAELEALVNEAAILAAMRDHAFVHRSDLEEARDKVRFGRQKKSRVMDLEDKKITAYHEAGHALVNVLLENTEPVHKVTIIPRGMALGATMMLPEKDRMHMSKKQLLDELAVLYGGRVAEDLFCDDITSGASNDIQRATQLARLMVTEWGMSDALGPIRLSERTGSDFLGNDFAVGRDHSEETQHKVDEEVAAILDAAHQRARNIIENGREEMERIAQALLKYETIEGEEVNSLVDGVPPEDLRPPKPESVPPPLPSPQEGEEPESKNEASSGHDVPPAGEEGLSPA